MAEYCRTESGRVFKREPGVRGDGWLTELSGGRFVAPLSPITGGELMDAEPLSEAEVWDQLDWAAMLDRDYPDEASKKLIDGWRSEGKSDREIYLILESLW